MKSVTFRPNEAAINRKWHLLDADGKVLGRLATQIADALRGKRKPIFCNDIDCGDFVVVINASKTKLTGKKLEQKVDFRHSGYPGGHTLTYYSEMMEKHPEKVILLAVKGMLPKNKQGHKQLTRLRVFKTAEHNHAAQLAVAKQEKI